MSDTKNKDSVICPYCGHDHEYSCEFACIEEFEECDICEETFTVEKHVVYSTERREE